MHTRPRQDRARRTSLRRSERPPLAFRSRCSSCICHMHGGEIHQSWVFHLCQSPCACKLKRISWCFGLPLPWRWKKFIGWEYGEKLHYFLSQEPILYSVIAAIFRVQETAGQKELIPFSWKCKKQKVKNSKVESFVLGKGRCHITLSVHQSLIIHLGQDLHLWIAFSTIQLLHAPLHLLLFHECSVYIFNLNSLMLFVTKKTMSLKNIFKRFSRKILINKLIRDQICL